MTETMPEATPSSVPASTSVDLNLLRCFKVVYDAGSLTAAAPVLAVSQPTLTARIQQLEAQRGEALFLRRPRGLEPTAAAHRLAALVAGPLDELAAVGADAALDRAPVRLAGPSELLCTRVLPALAPLTGQGLRLQLTQGMTETLVGDLRAGRCDLAIVTKRLPGQALDCRPLGDEEYVAVVGSVWSSTVVAGADVAAAAEVLRRVPLVAYDEDLPLVRRYWRTVLGRPLEARAAITVPNLHAVVAAVVAGAGYSVLPRSLCAAGLATGALAQVCEPEVPPLNTLFIAARTGAVDQAVGQVRDRLLAASRTW